MPNSPVGEEIGQEYPGAGLERVANKLESAVAASDNLTTHSIGLGLCSSLLRLGHESGFFATNYGEATAPSLDLPELGLPGLPAELAEHGRPLGVVVERGKTGTQSIRLFLHSKEKGGNLLFLESPSNAESSDSSPQWLVPWRAVTKEGAANLKTPVRHRNAKHGLVEINAPGEPQVPGRQVQLIRARLSRTERRMMSENKIMPKIVRRLGGVLAAATLALHPIATHFEEADSSTRVITAAEQMVQPAGTVEADGAEQAEAYFDEVTLSRSRAAFAAHFQEDKVSLEAQTEGHGYQAHWLEPGKIQAIREAGTSEELQNAFAAAVGSLPVTLKVLENVEDIPTLAGTDSSYYAPVPDLTGSKAAAEAILDDLNMLDPRIIANDIAPVSFVTVGSLYNADNPYTPENETFEIAGYCWGYTDVPCSEIALSVRPQRDYLDDIHINAAHEISHSLDRQTALHDIIEKLNPPGHHYLGSAYAGSAIEINGMRVAASDYANVNSGEDAAVTAENVLNADPDLFMLDKSPLTEKTLATIYNLERQYPGFTAAWLQAMEGSLYMPRYEIARHARLEAWNKYEPLLTPAAGLILLAAGSLGVSAYYSRRTRKRAGVVWY